MVVGNNVILISVSRTSWHACGRGEECLNNILVSDFDLHCLVFVYMAKTVAMNICIHVGSAINLS